MRWRRLQGEQPRRRASALAPLLSLPLLLLLLLLLLRASTGQRSPASGEVVTPERSTTAVVGGGLAAIEPPATTPTPATTAGLAAPEPSITATAKPPPLSRGAGIGEPAAVEIPALGVNAALVGVGLEADGAMEVPDFGLAGWYELGPKPGEPGPAVIVGHVDSRAGPDVFFRLKELRPGEHVVVRSKDGTSSTFVVEALEQTPKTALPVERIWNATDQPVLRLVTCGGSFDRSTRSYRDNVVVYASAA